MEKRRMKSILRMFVGADDVLNNQGWCGTAEQTVFEANLQEMLDKNNSGIPAEKQFDVRKIGYRYEPGEGEYDYVVTIPDSTGKNIIVGTIRRPFYTKGSRIIDGTFPALDLFYQYIANNDYAGALYKTNPGTLLHGYFLAKDTVKKHPDIKLKSKCLLEMCSLSEPVLSMFEDLELLDIKALKAAFIADQAEF